MESLSENARNVMPCPFCRELIAKGAIRCRHCQADLKLPLKKKKRSFWAGQFMFGFYTATLIWLAIIIMYLWKF